jgi:chloramphenicol 3-O phosphotransferase
MSGRISGWIVVFNGAPRVGKVEHRARDPSRPSTGSGPNLGVDVFRGMTPARFHPGIGLRPGEPDHPAAPFLPAMYQALCGALAALSKVGHNVVVDIAHHDPAILTRCARLVAGLPAFLVGVHAPIEVVMARRAESPDGNVVASQGQPVPGPILRWQREVHRPGIYDLELDTSMLTPAGCALPSASAWPTARRRRPSARWLVIDPHLA